MPLPGGVARQFKQWSTDNAFLNDRIFLDGDRVHLADITAAVPARPRACATTSSRPPRPAPLIGLIGSEDKQELQLDAGHVGLMVGRTAAKNTLPVVIDFLKQAKRGQCMTIADFKPEHVEALGAFFQRLPESDLTFIKEDVSPAAVADWPRRTGHGAGSTSRRTARSSAWPPCCR